MAQEFEQFEKRKVDHVKLALDESNQAAGLSLLSQVALVYDSLPNLNLNDVSIALDQSKHKYRTPFFIASMTAGHSQAGQINSVLATLASTRGWVLGVGSQRREFESFENEYVDQSISDLHKRFPDLKLISNLGIAQVTEAYYSKKISSIIRIAEKMGASFIGVHLNPLQEAIQAEGTPNYKGAEVALAELIKVSSLPVIVKETGCGMSEATLVKLNKMSPYAIDISGLGGTHWGRIEGKRSEVNSVSESLGETFKDWGISTLSSLLNARKVSSSEIWASGGVRTGLDAAKLLALGATRVGFAMPALQAAMQGEAELNLWMEKIEKSLKVAMFCTNSANLSDLSKAKVTYERN